MSRRPNVVVLMSDEQSWNTLGAHGNPAARTPHQDRLAEDGWDLEHCYTPFPLCCPSRTSMITGAMPRHHHVLGNWRALAPELVGTGIGAEFSAAGYHTAWVGKWHVPGSTPATMGFRASDAVPEVLQGKDRGRFIQAYRDWVTDRGHVLDPRHIENLTAADIATLADPASPHRGTSSIGLEEHLETWQTDRFLDVLDEAPEDRPFLAFCSWNSPHFPLLVPEPFDRVVPRELVELPASWADGPDALPAEVRDSSFASRFADLDREGWVEAVAHYWGLVSLFDHQVGRVLQHLERIGHLDDTIVVVTSDHGDMMGAHRLVEKGHLLHYEEALRVPLLISHPDGGSGRRRALTSLVDLGPTLCELAGIAPGAVPDGRSFAGALGSDGDHRDVVTSESVLWEMDSERAHGEHRDPADLRPDRDALNASVFTGRYRWTFRSRDRDELYDLVQDPDQRHDLAADPSSAGVVAALRTRLAEELSDTWDAVSWGLLTP